MGEYKDRTGKTRLGMFLSEKAPNILDVVGDFLPDSGALGIIKNLIDNDDAMSPSDRATAQDMIAQELRELEMAYKDTENARNREIELSKSDAPIISKVIVPILALAWSAFAFTLYILLLMGKISSLESIQALVISSITNIVMLIIGYYFGSSQGSKDKQDKLNTLGK